MPRGASRHRSSHYQQPRHSNDRAGPRGFRVFTRRDQKFLHTVGEGRVGHVDGRAHRLEGRAVLDQYVQGIVDPRVQTLLRFTGGLGAIEQLFHLAQDQVFGQVAEAAILVAGGAQLADRVGTAYAGGDADQQTWLVGQFGLAGVDEEVVDRR